RGRSLGHRGTACPRWSVRARGAFSTLRTGTAPPSFPHEGGRELPRGRGAWRHRSATALDDRDPGITVSPRHSGLDGVTAPPLTTREPNLPEKWRVERRNARWHEPCFARVDALLVGAEAPSVAADLLGREPLMSIQGSLTRGLAATLLLLGSPLHAQSAPPADTPTSTGWQGDSSPSAPGGHAPSPTTAADAPP